MLIQILNLIMFVKNRDIMLQISINNLVILILNFYNNDFYKFFLKIRMQL